MFTVTWHCNKVKERSLSERNEGKEQKPVKNTMVYI